MAPGLNPAAFNLPCSSRTSSGVNAAEAACAAAGICVAGGRTSGVDRASSFGAAAGATGGGEIAEGEAAGAEVAAGEIGGGEAILGDAGGGEPRGTADGGAETDGGIFASSLPVGGAPAFACSTWLDGPEG